MECRIGVISGDGIGPEIIAEAKKVLNKIGETCGHTFHYEDILMGGCSIDATGEPLTEEAIAAAKASDAVLMGSIGGNTSTSPWYRLPQDGGSCGAAAFGKETGGGASSAAQILKSLCESAAGISL